MPEEQPTNHLAQTNDQSKYLQYPAHQRGPLDIGCHPSESRSVPLATLRQFSSHPRVQSRSKSDNIHRLDAAQENEIRRRIAQINRMALDAPHWFGLGERELQDNAVSDEEEGEFTRRYGIEIEEGQYEQASRGVLLFPRVAADADMGLHRRTQQVLQFRPVINRSTIGVFSLVGGVGATSIAATLARLLANCGERVILADAGGHTLLPRYFGGKGSKQGAIRRFDPIKGSPNRSIRIISLDVESYIGCHEELDCIFKDFGSEAARVDRVIWDLGNAPADWVARILQPGIRVLVPLLPTAKCLMQLSSTEELLRRIQNSGCTAQWQYILNQFDELDPCQVEIRARFRTELGDRLLPFILRASPLVNEALLCGKNIVDHAPACPLVSDLWRLARSVTGMAAPYPAIAPEAWAEA